MSNNFYFTFGTCGKQPFRGGWVKVTAKTERDAADIFNKLFPPINPPFVNCASIYREEKFKETEMYKHNSNLGAGCHLEIRKGLTTKFYLYAAGDPSVGIQSTQTEMDLKLDVDHICREELRQSLVVFFSEIYDEPVSIEFEDEKRGD